MTDCEANLIKTALQKIANQNLGEVVLYNFILFIQESTLSTLGITNALFLESPATADSIIRLDDEMSKVELRCCDICFLELQGSDFETLSECLHTYCRDCLVQHCVSRIASGQMTNVLCPDPDCRSKVDCNIVKRLVDPNLFELYDRTNLNFAIQSMSNTVWCPRRSCEHPAQAILEDNLGQCPMCGMSFCLQCKAAYHGKSPCKEDTKTVLDIQDNHDKDLDLYRKLMKKRGLKEAHLFAKTAVTALFYHLEIREVRQMRQNYLAMSDEKRDELHNMYGAPFVTFFMGNMDSSDEFMKFLDNLQSYDFDKLNERIAKVGKKIDALKGLAEIYGTSNGVSA